jgi:hypothetical protein
MIGVQVKNRAMQPAALSTRMSFNPTNCKVSSGSSSKEHPGKPIEAKANKFWSVEKGKDGEYVHRLRNNEKN